jgi:hypothetical protein
MHTTISIRRAIVGGKETHHEECKEFYRLTNTPMIAIPIEDDDDDKSSPIILKLGIDEKCSEFNLDTFINTFCRKLGLPSKYLHIKKIQEGSAILEAEITDKLGQTGGSIKLQLIHDTLTDKLKADFAQMKLFFMYMGSIQRLANIQKFRSEIKLNPKFNLKYGIDSNYWKGAINDGRDRGNQPYYCPVGWKRWSFYVTDNFDEKFKGWSICYHGTKFEYGLAILLSGLKTARIVTHGAGISATPSINYACHPRYAEVKQIPSSKSSRFFSGGEFAQFVLECRVHPTNIEKIARETLAVKKAVIDPNIDNSKIEWLIKCENEDMVDFTDPNASIVCTGIMVRVTDTHPGLLPESAWWYQSHICDGSHCCQLSIPLESLKDQYNNKVECNIISD